MSWKKSFPIFPAMPRRTAWRAAAQGIYQAEASGIWAYKGPAVKAKNGMLFFRRKWQYEVDKK